MREELTARYIDSMREVRLYKDDGHYWPIKFDDPDLARGFVRFVLGIDGTGKKTTTPNPDNYGR